MWQWEIGVLSNGTEDKKCARNVGVETERKVTVWKSVDLRG